VREEIPKKNPTVALLSLGCPKNLVDSEGMARALEKEGFAPAGGIEGADVLLINTCTFVKDATEESLEKIREGARLKRRGDVGCLIVAGCLAQRLGNRLADDIPEVDGLIGTGSWPKVAEVCRLVMSGGGRPIRTGPWAEGSVYPIRERSSFGHFGYLKITEGCHRCCSYCVIPSVRGPLRSCPAEGLLEEARALAAGGVREMLLVGEDTGAYGADSRSEWTLPRLLRELNRLDGIGWVRILYLHPDSLNQDLLEAAEECDKVCAYLDMPVQHASDRVLKRMRRPTSKRDLERALKLAKLSPKDLALRTTVMLGFPGETDADFQELMDFVKTWEFDHLGAFCYSREEGTDAACYPDQVDTAVALARRSELMEAQAKISLKRNKAEVGRTAKVLVDEMREDALVSARTERQAPEIDGVTLVADAETSPGGFLRVKITDAGPYDLAAVALAEDTT
jgi:ribosomal protein S12 methylthiotransferase